MPMKVTGMAKSRPQDAAPGIRLPKSAPTRLQILPVHVHEKGGAK
jgi:hypothetical protein